MSDSPVAGSADVLTEFVPVERAELAQLREDSAHLTQLIASAGKMRGALEVIRDRTTPAAISGEDGFIDMQRMPSLLGWVHGCVVRALRGE